MVRVRLFSMPQYCAPLLSCSLRHALWWPQGVQLQLAILLWCVCHPPPAVALQGVQLYPAHASVLCPVVLVQLAPHPVVLQSPRPCPSPMSVASLTQQPTNIYSKSSTTNQVFSPSPQLQPIFSLKSAAWQPVYALHSLLQPVSRPLVLQGLLQPLHAPCALTQQPTNIFS